MTAGESSPSDALRQMIQGYQVSRAIHVAAALGIADLLVDGPSSAGDLATSTDTHAPTLYRLLRLLASVGVFAEGADGRFSLTPRAESLRSDVPGSQRAWAIMMGGPSFWSSWGELPHSVRTGETAFPKVHGMDRWEYLARHPEESAAFDAAMTSLSAAESAAVVGGYDFSGIGVLADVGGGAGGLLAAILAAHPPMRGILFDRPHVVAGARDLLEREGVADRCRVVGGDFLESVPGGADAYLLKSVIHDWEDELAVRILRTCRAAMSGRAKLLLAERIIRPGNEPDPAKLIDLIMLVMNGGRERTADEFERLLDAAGFRLTDIVRTASPLSVIEATPA
jgi:hypothetical protein